jgi:hypothetical protein
MRPPAALFFYSSDRKGEHPQKQMKDFRGTIHADGYAGFNALFAGNRSARPPAGRMFAASSSTSMLLPPRQSRRKRSNASAISTRSRE